MKRYNCPDCQRTDSCEGCYRVAYLPVNLTYSDKSLFPISPCDNCNNNPKNGGSGICHCILGTQQINY